jgi:cyclohexanone monooxygenase
VSKETAVSISQRSAHVAEVHAQTLMDVGDQVHSWMMGANIENHEPRVLIYFGGANVYYDKLRESVNQCLLRQAAGIRE